MSDTTFPSSEQSAEFPESFRDELPTNFLQNCFFGYFSSIFIKSANKIKLELSDQHFRSLEELLNFLKILLNFLRDVVYRFYFPAGIAARRVAADRHSASFAVSRFALIAFFFTSWQNIYNLKTRKTHFDLKLVLRNKPACELRTSNGTSNDPPKSGADRETTSAWTCSPTVFPCWDTKSSLGRSFRCFRRCLPKWRWFQTARCKYPLQKDPKMDSFRWFRGTRLRVSRGRVCRRLCRIQCWYLNLLIIFIQK